MARWIEPNEPHSVVRRGVEASMPESGEIDLSGLSWMQCGRDWFVIHGDTGGWVLLRDDERLQIEGLADGTDIAQVDAPVLRRLLGTLWARRLVTIGGETAGGTVDWDDMVEETRQHYGLVMVLNSGCNLACTYCYLGHNDPSPENDLDQALARAAIDGALARPESKIVIDFGEVTVAPGNFFLLAEYARERAAEAGKDLSIALQTNGTTLTQTMVDALIPLDPILGVSLDGPAELHDLARPRRGGRPTHSLVVAGIRRCQEAGLNVHVIATIGAHNVDNPDSVLDQIAELNPTTFLCKPILAHGEAKDAWDAQGADPWRIAKFLDRSVTRVEQHGLGALDQSASKFLLRLIGDGRGWREGCTSRNCSSGRNLHVLSAHGELHSCPRFVEPGRGKAVTPGSVSLELTGRPLLADELRSTPASCAGCPWLRTCGGGCTLSGHEDDTARAPLPDQHCMSYDAQHQALVGSVLPALFEGRIPFDMALAGARLVDDGG